MPVPTLNPYEIEMALRRRREFMEAIQPIIRRKVRISCLGLERMILYPDGRMERTYTPEAQEMLDECDQAIQRMAEAYGLKKEGA